MTTIIPYFDPLLGKLRNSDIGLISLASITDPFIVNNLGVQATASINMLQFNNANGSTGTFGNLTTNLAAVNSIASINLGVFNGVIASTISANTIFTRQLFASNATIGDAHLSNINWNLNSGATATLEGQMNWSPNIGTAVLGLAGGNVDVALGLETVFPRRVRNSTGSTMPKGTVVYINGVSGNTPTIERAIATGDQSSAFTIGMTAESIANNATGWLTTFGEISGINLSSFTAGDTLYLSGVSAGLYTNQRVYAPFHYVRVGTVVKATTDGSLIVNVINGFETNELHDVSITSLASGHILQSNGSLWQNRSLASALSILSLGSLAVQNSVNFFNLVSYPSLGSLSIRNNLNFFELVSYPSLGSLSIRNNLNFFELVSYPSLGSLSIRNNLNFFELVSYPSLGSLSIKNNLNFFELVSYPSLGSLSIRNNLNFFDLISYPSLGSLSIRNNLNFFELVSYPSLGSLSILNQLSFFDLTSRPSLGSISALNVIVHGSTVSRGLDDHTQYLLIAGRSGGQLLYGGITSTEHLYLFPNSVPTTRDGKIFVNPTESYTLFGHSQSPIAKFDFRYRPDAVDDTYSISNTLEIESTAPLNNKTAMSNVIALTSNVSGVVASVTAEENFVNVDGSSNTQVDYVVGQKIRYKQENSDVFDIRLLETNIVGLANASIGYFYNMYLSNACIVTKNAAYSIYSDGGTSYHKGTLALGENNMFPTTNSALDIMASSSDHTNNAIYATNSNATTLFIVRNDGRIGINQSAASNFVTSIGTDFSNWNASTGGLTINSNLNYTTSKINFYRTINFGLNMAIASNVSIGGYVYGFSADMLRDVATDRGFIQSVEAVNFAYGHYRSAASSIRTFEAKGINVRPYSETGVITNLYGLFIDNISTNNVAGTVTNSWAIYSKWAANSYLLGRLGIADETPDAMLDVNQNSTTAAIPTLVLQQSDLSEEFINFESTIGTGNPIIASSTATTFSHKIRIAVNGSFKWLYAYNA